MTDEKKYSIVIDFDDENTVNYSLKISPGVTIEQIALVAAKLRFLANFAWTTNENMRAMQAAEMIEKQGKIITPGSGKIIKPQ